MDLIVGLLLLVYAGGLLVFSKINNNLNFDLYEPMFLLKLGVSLSGAAYLIVYQNLNKIKDLLNKGAGVFNFDEKDTNTVSKDLMDYKALTYLRGRAKEIKSQEMMDYLVKINNLLFSNADKI